MIYVIDANNLAGKLDLLAVDDFDKILIRDVKKYFALKKIKVILVFDSSDPMGDKQIDGNFEIIYTPRDNFYKDADDKVLEIVVGYLDNGLKQELIVVTDDIELQEKIKDKVRESEDGYRVKVLKASDFADKMECFDDCVIIEQEDFSENEAEELKKELLDKWS